MTTVARHRGPTTLEEWQGLPVEKRYELIDGELVEKAAPDFRHGDAQAGLLERLRPWFHRRTGGQRPGGWWIVSEVDIELNGDGYRPDITGWRRERVLDAPRERPVRIRPDWICEIVSDSNATTDTIRKLRRYHQAGIPHFWLLDPATKTLVVHRHAPAGYLAVLLAEVGEVVRAEPFEAAELHIGALFGEEPEDP